MKARNIYAVLASKRKAGSHRKSNKALRRLEKSRGNFDGEVRTLTPREHSSTLCRGTTQGL